MNSAADLGGTFIVPEVIALAFAQIINMRDRTLRDRLDSDQFKGGNGSSQLRQFIYFRSCFENVHMTKKMTSPPVSFYR